MNEKEYITKEIIIPTLGMLIILLATLVNWSYIKFETYFFYGLGLTIYGIFVYIVYKNKQKNHDQEIIIKEANGGL